MDFLRWVREDETIQRHRSICLICIIRKTWLFNCGRHFEEKNTEKGNYTGKQKVGLGRVFCVMGRIWKSSEVFYWELFDSFFMTVRGIYSSPNKCTVVLIVCIVLKSFIGKLENFSRLNWCKMTNFISYFESTRKSEMDPLPKSIFHHFVVT
jgi:hypothetical protein